MAGKFQVHLPNEESTQEFEVIIDGPEDSLYAGVSVAISSNARVGNLGRQSVAAGVVSLQVTFDRL